MGRRPVQILATTSGRLQALEDLGRGIATVNHVLRLSLPTPVDKNWRRSVFAAESSGPPDAFCAQLLAGVCDQAVDSDRWQDLLPAVAGMLPPADWMDGVLSSAANVHEYSDGDVVELAHARFTHEETDLIERLRSDGFVYAKINHGSWEYLTFVGCLRTGRAWTRPWERLHTYEHSRFMEVVARAIGAYQRRTVAMELPEGTLVTPDSVVGVGFGDGNRPPHEDLTLPLVPFVKGAVVGCASFFEAIGRPHRWRVGDGSGPKLLFWNDRLHLLCSRIAERSDALVFVVPPHLASIAMPSWQGAAFTLVIPGTAVSEMWPATLPLLVGTLERLAQEHPRLTILAQASDMSGLLGIVLGTFCDRAPMTQVAYIDMGQVLDLAAPDHPDAGIWIRRRDVRDKLATLREPPPFDVGAR